MSQPRPGKIAAMAELSPADILAALSRDVRLRGYLRDGKIAAMPAKRSRRLLLLTEIAHAFEPGVRYPERAVNEVLGAMFPDYAALRRYLVDEEMLDRAHGQYWRIGGQVQPSQGW